MWGFLVEESYRGYNISLESIGDGFGQDVPALVCRKSGDLQLLQIMKLSKAFLKLENQLPLAVEIMKNNFIDKHIDHNLNNGD